MKQFGDCRACPPEGGDGHWYRQQFIAADQMWNVVRPSQLCRPLQPREQSDKGGLPLQSGSGGTNAACLAATPQPERWKCLMAEYIAPYLKTPIFVMNSVRHAPSGSCRRRSLTTMAAGLRRLPAPADPEDPMRTRLRQPVDVQRRGVGRGPGLRHQHAGQDSVGGAQQPGRRAVRSLRPLVLGA